MAVIEILADEECWKRLPEASLDSGQPLPLRHRTVAVHLPRTAAAMFALDYAHRTKSPVAPILCAKMQWVVADCNHC